MSTPRWMICFFGFLLLAAVLRAETEVKQYRPPDFDKEIFNPDALEWDRFDRAAVVKVMLHIARDFNTEDGADLTTRAYALAIGNRLDPGAKEILRVDKQLKKNAESVSGTDIDKDRVIGRLAKKIDAIIGSDQQDNLLCAAYCVDIGHRFAPDFEPFQRQLKQLEAKKVSAEWEGVLGDPLTIVKRDPKDRRQVPADIVRRIIQGNSGTQESFETKWVKMPGGKADKIALRQSTVKGLVVVTLGNGAHAGAASTIDVTALRDEEAGDDLTIGIDQKVGSMMRNSIEEVVKLMRLRHEDDGTVPSGYKIEFGFPDKDQPKDGPSAGTAFALVLDSMFTGVELDPEFACTGAITKIGSVQPIGGVAAKIRGATKKGCRVVGVPVANESGVADVVVLDGIDQLLEVQIFTMTNFDEALQIARLDRDETTQKTMELFNKIAEVVKEKGHQILKHPKVIERLEVVLKNMPNHASAKYLLKVGCDEAPTQLSVGGSFQEANIRSNVAIEKLVGLVRGGPENFSFDQTDRELAAEASVQMKEIEGKVDPRVKDFFKTMQNCVDGLAKGILEGEQRKDFVERLDGLFKEFVAEQKKISNDPEIREEMMQ